MGFPSARMHVQQGEVGPICSTANNTKPDAAETSSTRAPVPTSPGSCSAAASSPSRFLFFFFFTPQGVPPAVVQHICLFNRIQFEPLENLELVAVTATTFKLQLASHRHIWRLARMLSVKANTLASTASRNVKYIDCRLQTPRRKFSSYLNLSEAIDC